MNEFDGRAFARSLTTGPGVYLMRDEAGKVLYVGKARNLRRRVASYFSRRNLGARLDLLVRKVASMEVSLTRTEAEALDRKSTRLNSSHVAISYAVFCLKNKKQQDIKKQKQ